MGIVAIGEERRGQAVEPFRDGDLQWGRPPLELGIARRLTLDGPAFVDPRFDLKQFSGAA